MMKKNSKYHNLVITYDRRIIQTPMETKDVFKTFPMIVSDFQTDSFFPSTKSKISFSVTKLKFLKITAAINRDITGGADPSTHF